MDLQNPHDKFFKSTFGDTEVAQDFLQHYLPEKLMQVVDINSLNPEKDSFINEQFRENFSDLLFSVNIMKKEGYIYFLFEHKSYPAKGTIIQLLTYMNQFHNSSF